MPTTKFAKITPAHEAFMWVARYAFGGLAAVALAFCVAEPTLISHASRQAPKPVGGAFGSGLLTFSLIDSARHELPVPGVETTIGTVLASGTYAGFVPTLTAASSLTSR